jgi:hypothetical protein
MAWKLAPVPFSQPVQVRKHAASELAEARREADAIDARLREVTARVEASRRELVDLVAPPAPAR